MVMFVDPEVSNPFELGLGSNFCCWVNSMVTFLKSKDDYVSIYIDGKC